MWPTQPRRTVVGPFIQAVCSISPFLPRTSYLALILFEVSNQSKRRSRDSFVLRPRSKKDNFLFYVFLSAKKTGTMSRRQPYWRSYRDCYLGARQTAQLPLITTWRLQPSLYPAQCIMFTIIRDSSWLHKYRLDSIFYMAGKQLAEFSRESWNEECTPRISLLKCSNDHNLSGLTSLLLHI